MFDIVQKYSTASKIVLGIIGLTFVVAGGVGANVQLRSRLDALAAQHNFSVHYPELHLCTDNGAMIAFAGAMRLMAGEQVEASDGRFAVRPRWSLQEITPPQAAA